MATEDGDLSDFDIHRIMEALATRQSKSVASCALSIKILLAEIQQQLLELMVDGNIADAATSNLNDATPETSDDFSGVNALEEFDATLESDDEESHDGNCLQDTVVTGATVPITGSRLKQPNPYPCTDCTMVFSTKKALTRHATVHNQISTEEDPVNAADSPDEKKCDELKTEPMDGDETDRKPIRIKLCLPKNSNKLKCEKCGIETLRQHMPRHMRRHTGVKPFGCDVCHASFARKDKLKEHMKKHEGQENPSPAKVKKVREPKTLKCKKCDFTTEDRAELKEHRKIHPTKMVFRCDECNKEFNCASHFEQHNIKHRNEKPYMCDMCGVSFSREPNLARHIRSHTTPAPYHCKFCKKPYHRNNELIVHERAHTGEKPYICEICGNGYASTKYLKRHLFTHTGLKPFKCDLCDRAFARPENMKAHRKLHEKASNRLSSNHDTIASAFRSANQMDTGTDDTVDGISSTNHTQSDAHSFPSTSNLETNDSMGNRKPQLNAMDSNNTESAQYSFPSETSVRPAVSLQAREDSLNTTASAPSIMDSFKMSDL